MKVTVTCMLVLVCAQAAWASRAPTPRERAAIEQAVRFFPPISRNNRLTFRKERVSTVDTRYARADVFVRDARGRAIGSVTTLLRRRSTGWRVIFFGTDPPPCTLVAQRVRVDLLGSKSCIRR